MKITQSLIHDPSPAILAIQLDPNYINYISGQDVVHLLLTDDHYVLTPTHDVTLYPFSVVIKNEYTLTLVPTGSFRLSRGQPATLFIHSSDTNAAIAIYSQLITSSAHAHINQHRVEFDILPWPYDEQAAWQQFSRFINHPNLTCIAQIIPKHLNSIELSNAVDIELSVNMTGHLSKIQLHTNVLIAENLSYQHCEPIQVNQYQLHYPIILDYFAQRSHQPLTKTLILSPREALQHRHKNISIAIPCHQPNLYDELSGIHGISVNDTLIQELGSVQLLSHCPPSHSDHTHHHPLRMHQPEWPYMHCDPVTRNQLELLCDLVWSLQRHNWPIINDYLNSVERILLTPSHCHHLTMTIYLNKKTDMSELFLLHLQQLLTHYRPINTTISVCHAF